MFGHTAHPRMAYRCLFPGKQGLEEFLELADFIPGIVGAKAPSVDGEGKVAVHPPNEPFWWMARRDGAACHPRLGGACEARAVRERAGGGRRCRPGPPEPRPQARMARPQAWMAGTQRPSILMILLPASRLWLRKSFIASAPAWLFNDNE